MGKAASPWESGAGHADSPVLGTSDGGGLRWEMGGRLKAEGKCVYLWLIQVDGRNQHNIVKQLSYS